MCEAAILSFTLTPICYASCVFQQALCPSRLAPRDQDRDKAYGEIWQEVQAKPKGEQYGKFAVLALFLEGRPHFLVELMQGCRHVGSDDRKSLQAS